MSAVVWAVWGCAGWVMAAAACVGWWRSGRLVDEAIANADNAINIAENALAERPSRGRA